MRLKITRRLSGSIDGLQLSHFEPGELYDVGTSLGSYLLALGAAEPVLEEVPGTSARDQIAEAADNPPRKR